MRHWTGVTPPALQVTLLTLVTLSVCPGNGHSATLRKHLVWHSLNSTWLTIWHLSGHHDPRKEKNTKVVIILHRATT